MSEERRVTPSEVMVHITLKGVTPPRGKGTLGYWLFYQSRTWRAGYLHRTDSDGKPSWSGVDTSQRLSFLQLGKAPEE